MAGKKGYGACLEIFVLWISWEKLFVSLWNSYVYVLDFGLIRTIYEDAIKTALKLKWINKTMTWQAKTQKRQLPAIAGAIFQRFRKNWKTSIDLLFENVCFLQERYLFSTNQMRQLV